MLGKLFYLFLSRSTSSRPERVYAYKWNFWLVDLTKKYVGNSFFWNFSRFRIIFDLDLAKLYKFRDMSTYRQPEWYKNSQKSCIPLRNAILGQIIHVILQSHRSLLYVPIENISIRTLNISIFCAYLSSIFICD